MNTQSKSKYTFVVQGTPALQQTEYGPQYVIPLACPHRLIGRNNVFNLASALIGEVAETDTDVYTIVHALVDVVTLNIVCLAARPLMPGEDAIVIDAASVAVEKVGN